MKRPFLFGVLFVLVLVSLFGFRPSYVPGTQDVVATGVAGTLTALAKRTVMETAAPTNVLPTASVATPTAISNSITLSEAAIDLSSDGKYVLSYAKSSARVWDTVTGRMILQTLNANGGFWHGSISPGGTYIVILTWDKTAQVYEVASGKLITDYREHFDGHLLPGGTARFSADSKYVVTAAGATARVWETLSGKTIGIMSVGEARYFSMDSAIFSPDSRHIVTIEGKHIGHPGDAYIRLWHAPSGQPIATLGDVTYEGWAEFSPDSKLVFAADSIGNGSFWNIETGRQIVSLDSKLPDLWRTAAFSNDGRSLLTIGRFGDHIFTWDIKTGKKTDESGIPMDSAAVLSPDGRLIAVQYNGNIVRLIDPISHQTVRDLSGLDGSIVHIAFSPDSKWVAALNTEKVLRLWSVYGLNGSVNIDQSAATIAANPVSTSTPVPLKTAEEFGRYSSNGQLQSTYIINAAWGANTASIRLDNALGVSTMRLDYDIRGATPSDNYVVLDRCIQPSQDWRGARSIDMWMQNDSKPKQVVVQFGEGYKCTGGDFPFEVWRMVVNLVPGQTGRVSLPLASFEQETGWARSINNRIDLGSIGYFSLGIRGSALGNGSIHFGPIQLSQ